jgi:hypothetical protein
MFPLKIKKRYFFSTIFFCFSYLLSQTNIALAQMRLGRGIQPGLEGHLLEYQIQQQPLEKMQGISGCSVGFGAGCNKTASLLQKIVTEYSGKTYQDILLQAAGGRDNYLRFTSHYPQSVDLDSMPLNSFWIDGGNYVLDSHQYSGVEDLNRIPQANLDRNFHQNFHQVVSQFTYAPVALKTENLNLKEGLIGLKTTYGKALLEEALKIPNIEQKIAASGLSSSEINFHLQQFLHSKEALENGNERQLNHSLYELLSNPYTSDPGVLNRPSLGISSNLNRQMGIGLEGEEYISSLIAPSLNTANVSETVIFNSADIATATGSASGSNTPLYVAAGIGGLTILALLLTGLDVDSSSDSSAIDPLNGGNGKPPDLTIPTPPGNGVITIPETTSTIQFVFLVALALLTSVRVRTTNRFK